MTTLRDVAQALSTGDALAMAQTLGLNPPNVSMRALIQAFGQAALPQVPINLSPSGDGIPISPPVLSWADPAAATFARATSYAITFDEAGLPILIQKTVPGPPIVYPNSLKYDQSYELDVIAINKYGQSGVASNFFKTVSDPGPGGPVVYQLELMQDIQNVWYNYFTTFNGSGVITQVKNASAYQIDISHLGVTAIDTAGNSITAQFNGAQINGYWSATLKGPIDKAFAPPFLVLQVTVQS